MSTKVSDLAIVAACQTCHDLLDRTHTGWERLLDEAPAAVQARMFAASQETLAMWLDLGVIVVPDGEIL